MLSFEGARINCQGQEMLFQSGCSLSPYSSREEPQIVLLASLSRGI